MNEKEYRKLIKNHPELAEFIHFVRRPTKNGEPGYYRIVPFTYFEPHVNQLRHRLVFSQIAYDSFGAKGLDPSGLPPTAAKIKEKMKGKKFKKPTFEETFKKLKKLAKVIGKEVEAVVT